MRHLCEKCLSEQNEVVLPARASFRKLSDVLVGVTEEISNEAILYGDLLCALAALTVCFADGDAVNEFRHRSPVKPCDLQVLTDEPEPFSDLIFSTLSTIELFSQSVEFAFQSGLLQGEIRHEALKDGFRQFSVAFVLVKIF